MYLPLLQVRLLVVEALISFGWRKIGEVGRE